MTTATHTPVRINPTSWNVPLGFDQAQLRSTPERLLTQAGQGPVDESGALLHEGDVTAQLALAMANVEALLALGGMDLRDVLSMTVHTTDVDAALAGYGAIVERLTLAGATPPATLVGVTRLAIPRYGRGDHRPGRPLNPFPTGETRP
jgi:enamine deaminase RidA (YjgF/YER057c/UK114 family)